MQSRVIWVKVWLVTDEAVSSRAERSSHISIRVVVEEVSELPQHDPRSIKAATAGLGGLGPRPGGAVPS